MHTSSDCTQVLFLLLYILSILSNTGKCVILASELYLSFLYLQLYLQQCFPFCIISNLQYTDIQPKRKDTYEQALCVRIQPCWPDGSNKYRKGIPMPLLPVHDNNLLARRASEDARQYVYRVIKLCILEFLLSPGQKMNEADLAQSLSVSRTPVHDTIFKLSRENLADIYPKRGAFVSRLSPKRIEHAVWTHTQLGTSVIHSIHIKNTPRPMLETLYYYLHQLDDFSSQGDASCASRLIIDYYQQLYMLSGDMELIWDSLQKIDVDLRRLLYLVTSSPTVTQGFLHELNSLTEALISRDNDKACQIYASHLSRILMLLPLMQQHNPDYFLSKRPDGFMK